MYCIPLRNIETALFSWCHENGYFSIHTFIRHFLIYPTVHSWGNRFKETHGTSFASKKPFFSWNSKKNNSSTDITIQTQIFFYWVLYRMNKSWFLYWWRFEGLMKPNTSTFKITQIWYTLSSGLETEKNTNKSNIPFLFKSYPKIQKKEEQT